MLRYYGTTYGTVTIKQTYGDTVNKFKVEIRAANCLCAFIHVRKTTEEEREGHPERRYLHTLYSFLADERHAKNIMKDNDGRVFFDEVTAITLNTYYKETWKLLRLFTKSGYKVKCYYKEPKKK